MRGIRRGWRSFAAASVIAVLSSVTLAAPGHVAAAAKTMYVGTSIGNNSGCGSPGFTDVQTAVWAAPVGGRVYLCGANAYSGPVVINKNLTLTGDQGATISPTPAGTARVPLASLPPAFTNDQLFAPQSLITVWGAGVTASITGLTVTGPFSTPNGCADDLYGILVIAGGDASISQDQVNDIESADSSLNGCQFGLGIRVGREYWKTADFASSKVENFSGTARIDNTTVQGYAKNGITVDGPASVAITGSTITGYGRTSQVAQNGIQISRGATGSVVHTTVSGNAYTGAGWAYSAGLLLYGGCGDPLDVGVSVHNSTFVNNDVGLAPIQYDDACTGPPTTPTNADIHNNTITNDAVTNISGYGEVGSPPVLTGYQAGISDYGNGDSIHNNTISGPGYDPSASSSTVVVLPVDTGGSANVQQHTNRYVP